MTKKKLIGVTNLKTHFPTKQDVLLFDQIAIGGLDVARSKIQNPAIVAEIDFLLDEGIVFDASDDIGRDTIPDSPKQHYLELMTVTTLLDITLGESIKDPSVFKAMTNPKLVERFVEAPTRPMGDAINRQRVAESLHGLLQRLHERLGASPASEIEALRRELSTSCASAAARAMSIFLGGKLGFDTVPLVPYPQHDDLLMPSVQINTVANVVIKNLPTPSADTPWEAILDFRGHPDTQRRLFEFRHWMGKVAKGLADGTTSVSELEQELEYLTHEYTEHMKLAKLKIVSTTAETLITLVAELAEDVIKLKFKDAARAVFSLRRRKIALLEAERQAPGREIAYLVEASRVFGDP